MSESSSPTVTTVNGWPSARRVTLVTMLSALASLVVNAALVWLATAFDPPLQHYSHFRLSDYGTLTIVGVAGAGVAWYLAARILTTPRRTFFRVAVVVMVVLWVPDVWLLIKHEPTRAVVFLVIMHAAVALITYNFLVHAAPVGVHDVTSAAVAPHLHRAGALDADEPPTRVSRGVWVFLLVTVVVLCFGQGDMQQLYYAGLGMLVYLASRPILASEKGRGHPLLALLGAGFLGILLAGPVLFPELQYAWLSTRTEANYSFFLARPPALADLRTLLAPCDNGGMRAEFWENNFYFGFWLFPLLPFAFGNGWRRAAWLLGSLLLMLALCFDSPLLKFAYHCLPGFQSFRQSPRILLLAQFVLVFLAALGAENL